jgi:hypothetical protein
MATCAFCSNEVTRMLFRGPVVSAKVHGVLFAWGLPGHEYPIICGRSDCLVHAYQWSYVWVEMSREAFLAWARLLDLRPRTLKRHLRAKMEVKLKADRRQKDRHDNATKKAQRIHAREAWDAMSPMVRAVIGGAGLMSVGMLAYAMWKKSA